MAHAAAVRGADMVVLSDPGAACVPGAVSCCCGYSKVQKSPGLSSRPKVMRDFIGAM